MSFLWRLQVNINGVISFLKEVTQYTPAAFPLSDQRRIIAPFWADVNTRNGGTISYRQTTDPVLLQRATDDVRRAFLDHQRFLATWIFIATWERVAFHGASASGKSKVHSKILTLLRRRLTRYLSLFEINSCGVFGAVVSAIYVRTIWHDMSPLIY